MESLIHVALAGVSRLCIIDQRWPHLRIGFYGDEANISENPHQPFKVLCLFLNILHYRPRSARLSRFLLCAIRSDWLIHPLTLRPILARITWSLNVAFHGYEPGQPTVPLCSRGDRFVLAECRGDQEFHRTLWQHAASWKSKFICYQCRATSIGVNNTFVDFSENPAWSTSVHTTVGFINVELPPIPCYLAMFGMFDVLYNFENLKFYINKCWSWGAPIDSTTCKQTTLPTVKALSWQSSILTYISSRYVRCMLWIWAWYTQRTEAYWFWSSIYDHAFGAQFALDCRFCFGRFK